MDGKIEFPRTWSKTRAGLNQGKFGPFTFLLVPSCQDYNDENVLETYYRIFTTISEDSMLKTLNMKPGIVARTKDSAIDECQFTIAMLMAEIFTWK